MGNLRFKPTNFHKTEISNLFKEVRDIDRSKLKVLFVHTDESLKNQLPSEKYSSRNVPIFWALYEDKLLYVVCDHRMGFLESISDWDNFNQFEPGEYELSKLLSYNPNFYLVRYDVFLNKEVRDSICQWEMDIISEWNRERKINELLNGK